jgi:hypothetical protein
MTPQQIEALKLALEALESCTPQDTSTGHVIYAWHDEELVNGAITVLKERLADPMRNVQRLGQEIEQEPTCPDCKAEVLYECVACSSNNYPPPQRTEQEPCVHAKTPKECYRVRCQLGDKCVDDEMSFRTTPPQRKPLTYEQITTISNKGAEGGAEDSIYRFVRAIEAAHGIKD